MGRWCALVLVVLAAWLAPGARAASPRYAEPIFITRATFDGGEDFVVVRGGRAWTLPGGRESFAGLFYNPYDHWWGTWWEGTPYPGGLFCGRLYGRATTFEGRTLGGERSGLDDRMVAALVAEDPRQDPPAAMIRQGRRVRAAQLLLDRAAAREEIERVIGGAMTNRRALRLAALLIAVEGAPAPAATLCWRAHREDPLLWREPIDGIRLLGNPRIRATLDRVRRHAERVETAPGWALAACVAQAAGEHDLARRYVTYAAALDPSVPW